MTRRRRSIFPRHKGAHELPRGLNILRADRPSRIVGGHKKRPAASPAAQPPFTAGRRRESRTRERVRRRPIGAPVAFLALARRAGFENLARALVSVNARGEVAGPFDRRAARLA
jgi:hypothetical protein